MSPNAVEQESAANINLTAFRIGSHTVDSVVITSPVTPNNNVVRNAAGPAWNTSGFYFKEQACNPDTYI